MINGRGVDADLQDDIDRAVLRYRAGAGFARTVEEKNRILNRLIPLILASGCLRKLSEIRLIKHYFMRQIYARAGEDVVLYDDAQLMPALDRIMQEFTVTITNVEVRPQELLHPGEYRLTIYHAAAILEFKGVILDGESQQWECDNKSIAIKPLADIEVILTPFPRESCPGYHEAKTRLFRHPVRILFQDPIIFECGPIAIGLQARWTLKCQPPETSPELQACYDRFDRIRHH